MSRYSPVNADSLSDGDYPFPSPDWYFSNQSWVDAQVERYFENRTGECDARVSRCRC